MPWKNGTGMTDNNDDKTLHVSGKKTLTLKPSGLTQGTVRQDMGRGRTKAVVVETRKRRPSGADEKPITAVVTPIVPKPQPQAQTRVQPQQSRRARSRSANRPY